ncbi:7528_t:CDS:2 [Diversispora eburnea]|uniref:7528_t:CDS:1 n=1 Tax=Diversispora eburnea TaxID=1213867 RepID=A0A9N9GFD3_9GLOM|nr:7528_t:CDS:2 [Diversispora eburnea]
MNFLIANSGNIKIDHFINATQSQNKIIDGPYLIWIPFEEFKDVKKIGQGGFSQIFKANWKINKGISYKGTIKRSKSERKIGLKVLNNSQNADTEFLNEYRYSDYSKYSDGEIKKEFSHEYDVWLEFEKAEEK